MEIRPKPVSARTETSTRASRRKNCARRREGPGNAVGAPLVVVCASGSRPLAPTSATVERERQRPGPVPVLDEGALAAGGTKLPGPPGDRQDLLRRRGVLERERDGSPSVERHDRCAVGGAVRIHQDAAPDFVPDLLAVLEECVVEDDHVP